ncbi:MAG: heterodisulfide reductase-related iron-sulfur binding cluster [Oscillospiraceae bacterium]
MDTLALIEQSLTCIQGENAPCGCACPLGVDVRELIQKLKKGDFSGAYKSYAKYVVFPEIVCRICDMRCASVCVRREVDDSIALRRLEQACCDLRSTKTSPNYFIPSKNKRVLVVGAGLTGLTCAVKLAKRGYAVCLREASERLGGALWELDHQLMPSELLSAELQRAVALKYLSVEQNNPVQTLDEGDFDVALVATGKSGENFGAPRKGVFAGGDLVEIGKSPLDAIRDGIAISYAMEAYLQTGTMEVEHPSEECHYAPRLSNLQPQPTALPQNGTPMSKEEAVEEASRCIECRCNECVDACEMLQFYKKNPKKTISDIVETIHKGQESAKTALRQSYSCTQCGACGPLCPSGIDFKQIFLEARRAMYRLGHVPPAFHDFALRDMAFSNDEAAFLLLPSGRKTVGSLFFPGCQLGASDAAYVAGAYERCLALTNGDAGIFQYCCGIPAHWAGREELYEQVNEVIRRTWESCGRPRVVMACASCMEMFAQHLPEIEIISLWELMDNGALLPSIGRGQAVAVFDPCSGWNLPRVQQSIRHLLTGMDFVVTEIANREGHARCCGYGGAIYGVNPELHQTIVENNVSLSELDYVTWCVNCRETFAQRGKSTWHILDLLLFGTEDRKHRQAPTLSERRLNRLVSKQKMLQTYAGLEEAPTPLSHQTMMISEELIKKMDEKLILSENVERCIAYAQESGDRLWLPDKECYCAHLQQGIITYWVEYQCHHDAFILRNVYSHRMEIQGTR